MSSFDRPTIDLTNIEYPKEFDIMLSLAIGHLRSENIFDAVLVLQSLRTLIQTISSEASIQEIFARVNLFDEVNKNNKDRYDWDKENTIPNDSS